jgi:hypothetical protein
MRECVLCTNRLVVVSRICFISCSLHLGHAWGSLWEKNVEIVYNGFSDKLRV